MSVGYLERFSGRQLKKERLARRLSLPEPTKLTGIDGGHLSRIENGKRPPTEKIAAACDRTFVERRGWFTEYFHELQAWSEVPPWFKPWSEHEMNSASLRAWSPGTVHGLLQTEDYARGMNAVEPRGHPEQVTERVANRMARQQRVLFRDDPPQAWFLVSVTSLRNMPARIMGGQLRHLLEVAPLPHVTVQVVPECRHRVAVTNPENPGINQLDARVPSSLGGQRRDTNPRGDGLPASARLGAVS